MSINWSEMNEMADESPMAKKLLEDTRASVADLQLDSELAKIRTHSNEHNRMRHELASKIHSITKLLGLDVAPILREAFPDFDFMCDYAEATQVQFWWKHKDTPEFDKNGTGHSEERCGAIKDEVEREILKYLTEKYFGMRKQEAESFFSFRKWDNTIRVISTTNPEIKK